VFVAVLILLILLDCVRRLRDCKGRLRRCATRRPRWPCQVRQASLSCLFPLLSKAPLVSPADSFPPIGEDSRRKQADAVYAVSYEVLPKRRSEPSHYAAMQPYNPSAATTTDDDHDDMEDLHNPAMAEWTYENIGKRTTVWAADGSTELQELPERVYENTGKRETVWASSEGTPSDDLMFQEDNTGTGVMYRRVDSLPAHDDDDDGGPLANNRRLSLSVVAKHAAGGGGGDDRVVYNLPGAVTAGSTSDQPSRAEHGDSRRQGRSGLGDCDEESHDA
jgi:hypothetical protein